MLATCPLTQGIQVEVCDLDGMTVEGLRLLCVRLGLRRNGVRGKLIERLVAKLRDDEARCPENLASD